MDEGVAKTGARTCGLERDLLSLGGPGESAESERRGRKSGFRDGPLEHAAGGHDGVTLEYSW
jgi:hypothetical protein